MCQLARCNLLFFSLCFLLGAWAFDYCSVPECPAESHVACKSSNSFGTACQSDVKAMNMSALRPKIIAAHNTYRNRIAGGKLQPFLPAVRMATMSWHAELAKLALINVKTCQMHHDLCLSTAEFPIPGQNLASSMWRINSRTDEDIILEDIGNWFEEHADAGMQNIRNYSSPTNGTIIGHFTVMVNEASTHIGCAAVKYTKSATQYQSYLACNYAVNNIKNRPVYEAGKSAATKCRTGVNPNYPNLCSVKEVYEL